MGAREYFTQDFFHNIPEEFKQNHELLDLFETQDKSVSAVKNWISNYRLFFGLFYLGIKTVGVMGIIILCIMIFLIKKINE